ncbi:MAG: hypothetical protein R6U44_10655 [Archaeoglobaceae archaeon]
MPERDILLERLEKKLSQKEKEVEELKRMTTFNDSKVEEIKSELLKELQDEQGNKKIRELEAKIVELNKTVQSLTSDVLYLKDELGKSRPEEKPDIDRQLRSFAQKQSEDNDSKGKGSDEIIRADPDIDTPDSKEEKDLEEQKEEQKADIIVCD